MFKIRWFAVAATVPDHKVWAMRSTKGEQTRAAIAEAALRMFREQGYEATTMRAIAKEVGVATGNAYRGARRPTGSSIRPRRSPSA